MRILAISLDLDDTLWPIEPVVVRAEQRLDRWLQANCPQVGRAFPVAQMRALREQIALQHPHLAHDFTAQRKLSLRAAFEPHGYGEAEVEAAFAEFYAARNEVDLYVDVLPALQRLAQRMPLISVSNGNADLARIGLSHLFAHSITAREEGIAKPAVQIFHSACLRLQIAPENVLHVGDDAVLDVFGAGQAGMQTAWLNRLGAAWSHVHQPDLVVNDLTELADWLENRLAA
ncbi:MAG: HAD family hydrolase [Tahibacter sp.]